MKTRVLLTSIVLVLIVLLSGTAFSQATATWPMSANTTGTQSGNVTAGSFTYSLPTGAFTAGSSTTVSNAAIVLASGTWICASVPTTAVTNYYEQFTVSAQSSYSLTPTSVSMYLASSGSPFAVQVSASTDGTSWTVLGSSTVVSATSVCKTSSAALQSGGASSSVFFKSFAVPASMSVVGTKSFYMRIYPYITGAATSNKNALWNGQIQIAGTTAAADLAPTVATGTAGSITTTDATISGNNITSIGTAPVTVSGVAWAATSGAETATSGSNFTTDGATSATTYPSTISSALIANTLYYVKAYATNSIGTSYGTEISFATLPAAPSVSSATSITPLGFTANWSAPSGGSVAITYTLDYGTDNTFGTYTELTSLSSTSQAISGLGAGTTYYYRVKAVNTTGSSDWSSPQSVTTSAASPTIALGSSSIAFGNKTITSIFGASYTITGTYLTADVVVTPPADFQISTDSSSWTSGALTLTQTGGNVSQKMYVKFSPSAVQAYSGTITHTSTDATEQDLAVSGTGVAVQPVTNFVSGMGNAQNIATWTSPTGSYDEVVVLAKSGSAVDQTPSGDGSGYTASAVFGSGTDLGSGSFVVYKGSSTTVTVTGLTNGTTYYYAAYVHYGTNWSVVATANATALPLAAGDYGSVVDGPWATLTTWKLWNGSTWASTPSVVPTTTASVWIINGINVTLGSSPYTCYDLHLISGTLKTGTTVTTGRYIKIYGSTVEVNTGCTLGSALTGDNADGLGLDIFSSSVTFTGTGGLISIDRLRTNIASTTVTIDHDITLNYHGSSNTGNAMAYYTVAGDNNTLTINAGKTLTFAPWACMAISATSHSQGALAQTVNINGTITFTGGSPDGGTSANGSSGWNGHYNYMSLAITGKAYNLNIGSTGILNVIEFCPNGTNAGNNAGVGDAVTIVNNGQINVSKYADFRNPSQTVTGTGTFNLASGATLRIGSANGIAASAASGPIQTDTRTFSSGANYSYDSSSIAQVAQVTGDGLPTTVNNLTINNNKGVTLAQATAVNGVLTLTSGTCATTGSNLLTLGSAATLSGASKTSFVSGPLANTWSTSTATKTYPIGSDTVYRPVSVTLTTPASPVLQMQVINGNAGGSAGSLDKISNIRYFQSSLLSGTAASGGTVKLSYIYGYYDGVLTPANLVVAQSTTASGTYTSLGNSAYDLSTVTSASYDPSLGNYLLLGSTGGNPLPVELTSFTATGTRSGAILAWKTATETNNFGFNIERRTIGSNVWSKVGFVAGHGTSTTEQTYNFADAVSAGTYAYRIAQVNNDGTVKTYNESQVTIGSAEKVLSLANYPNPFNPTTTFEFSVPTDGMTTVKVYNVLGQEVVTAFSGEAKAGQFNHASFDGSKFSSGVYFYAIENNGQRMIKKMLMMK